MKNENEETAGQGQEFIEISKMYVSLRYNDYALENGMGELVDNSIESGAQHVYVTFEKKKVKEGKKNIEVIDRIVVADDGCGMNKEVLGKCLVLGCSVREKRNGLAGIGKFGVGMTLGGISLARRIEVYSRMKETEDFLYTFIDLDMITKKEILKIPTPSVSEPPQPYKEMIGNSTGTIVVLSKCDRVGAAGKKQDAGELYASMANYLGRTYRKFIEAGKKIILDGKQVYLHDPLYMSGPTQFDTEGKTDPKAKLYSQTTIEWDIPGGAGKKAPITIRLSLLPKEWRLNIGDGGKSEAKKRKIDQNEGFSILRANREVLYAKIPYLIGTRGQYSYEENDRWWGGEISFPPELDECFQVKYIKRGAEPVGDLKDKLKDEITKSIISLRKIIKADRRQKKAEEDQAASVFDNAENMMKKVDVLFPANRAGKNLSKEEEDRKLEKLVNLTIGDSREEKQERKEQLRKEPYSIVPVEFPQPILFEPVFLLDKVVIQLNVNHPFYQKVLAPLCGDLLKEESQEIYNEKSKLKDAIMLLLLSYAKAVAGFPEENIPLFDNLLVSWGTVLATVVNTME